MNKGLIDYDNCITNLTSSIENHYGMKPSYKTMPAADAVLAEKKWKNVVLMCFDAMGCAVLDKNRIRNSFLADHKIHDMVSCYPCTTATCTTCYKTGKNPIETGWMGWSSYFAQEDITIENFTNKYTKTKEPVGGELRAWKYLSYTDLGTRINEACNDVEYVDLTLKDGVYNMHNSLQELTERLIEACNSSGKHFIYLYWNEPDSTMHDFGTENYRVRRILKKITRALQSAVKNTKDTVFLASADHGMMDVVRIPFWEYPQFMPMLRAFPSCDARTAFFFVKDGMKDQFKEEFNKCFGSHYELCTKEEVIENHVFGYCEEGKEHPLFRDLIGDFVAFAHDEYYFSFEPGFKHFKGHHAGLCDEEMRIPLIAFRS